MNETGRAALYHLLELSVALNLAYVYLDSVSSNRVLSELDDLRRSVVETLSVKLDVNLVGDRLPDNLRSRFGDYIYSRISPLLSVIFDLGQSGAWLGGSFSLIILLWLAFSDVGIIGIPSLPDAWMGPLAGVVAVFVSFPLIHRMLRHLAIGRERRRLEWFQTRVSDVYRKIAMEEMDELRARLKASDRV